MNDTVIVQLQIFGQKKQLHADIELPLNIRAEQVIDALCKIYALDYTESSCLICENPVALISGKQTLGEAGVRSGSIIKYFEVD